MVGSGLASSTAVIPLSESVYKVKYDMNVAKDAWNFW